MEIDYRQIYWAIFRLDAVSAWNLVKDLLSWFVSLAYHLDRRSRPSLLRTQIHTPRYASSALVKLQFCVDFTLLDIRWPLHSFPETDFIYNDLHIVQKWAKTERGK